MYQWLAEQYNTSVLYSGRLDDMASSRGSGPLIRLLSDGCRWKVDEGLGPATLQVVTRVKPKACAGMQGSRVKLQGTGTVTGHMASNIIHAYSIMPGHMHAILNYRQHTHTNMHTAGGRCLRLLVGSSRRVNQWETKRREIQVPFYVYFFTSLCRASLMLSLAVMFDIIAAILSEYSWMAHFQVQQ